MLGGRWNVVEICSPHVIEVLRVTRRPIEKRKSANAEGLKMWVSLPSRFHRINSFPSTPTATIANCRKNQSFLNHRNRFVLRTMGNGPNPKMHLSRCDQQTSMSSA